MAVRLYAPRLEWAPATLPGLERSMEIELGDWEGTPYESGQSFKHLAADCVGSVFGAIDGMDGRRRCAKRGMPADVSMHERGSAIAAMREIVRRYSPCTNTLPDTIVKPGDILVTGERGGGPGHVMLVGPQRNTLWHSTPNVGFHRTGWGLLESQTLFAVYRILDKERWC